jgi:hypothetical protein
MLLYRRRVFLNQFYPQDIPFSENRYPAIHQEGYKPSGNPVEKSSDTTVE